MTTSPALAGVRGADLFQPILEAAALGVIELPDGLARSIATAPRLAAATLAGRKAVELARTELGEAREAAIRKLAAGGPTSEPGLPVRLASARLAAAESDVDLLAIAAYRSLKTIPVAFIDAAPGIAGQLAERLPALLADARPHALVLEDARLDWTRQPLLELDERRLAAFRALEPLAGQHDALRRTALALFEDLRRHDDYATRRLAILRELDTAASQRGRFKSPDDAWIEQFTGGGLAGPARSLVGAGPSPAFEPRGWRWDPSRWAPRDHPVARLVDAALAPIPEPSADQEDEPEQAKGRDMRPIRPTAKPRIPAGAERIAGRNTPGPGRTPRKR